MDELSAEEMERLRNDPAMVALEEAVLEEWYQQEREQAAFEAALAELEMSQHEPGKDPDVWSDTAFGDDDQRFNNF